MQWYIERIFPVERRIVKTVRPLVSRVTTLPIAGSASSTRSSDSTGTSTP